MQVLTDGALKAAAERMLASCRTKLDPDVKSFRMCPEADIPGIKKRSITIYAYSNRVVRECMDRIHNPMLGVAVFDENGWLIRLYGSGQFRAWAEERGIVQFSKWTQESAGVNAVSLGMENNCSVELFGEQNYCTILKDTAFYFTPYLLDEGKSFEQEELKKFGGVAIITPYGGKPEDYLFTTSAIAKEICLHLHMVDSYESFFNTETEGHISIDFDLRTGVPHLLYHSGNIYTILGIREQNLHFAPVETVFDTPPRNRKFWQIINRGISVENCRITISIQGTERDFTLRTLPYCQNFVGFKGVHCFLQSQKLKTSAIARDAGNIAQLTFRDIVGESPLMLQTIRQAKLLASKDHTLLILGESGVGKDVFARAIHSASSRAAGPFVTLNCAGMPRELIASELFGYAEGAFTGAKRGGNMGKFELADSGTIFLDEIGDMPLELQATLLEILESKSFMRLGSNIRKKVDVRVIAATNANLAEKIRKHQFREDLYYRLSATKLLIPPLRARGTDIVLLAEHFISNFYSSEAFRPQPILSEDAKQLLMSLPWYGNVRELRNVITNAVSLHNGPVLQAADLRQDLSEDLWQGEREQTRTPAVSASSGLGRSRSISGEELEAILSMNRYNKSAVAKQLGISRKTLYHWMKQAGLD